MKMKIRSLQKRKRKKNAYEKQYTTHKKTDDWNFDKNKKHYKKVMWVRAQNFSTYAQVAISSSPACCSKLVDRDSRMSEETSLGISL